MLLKQWTFGDRVIHADRPEWGVGVVNSAVSESYEGRPSQRLTIRFDRAGVKTLSSVLANLAPAEDALARSVEREAPTYAEDGADPLKSDGPSLKDVLLRLPDACTDPFTTPRARLEATIRLFRFGEHGGALIDWASAQTGLKDPMTRLNRHELEDLYRRFVTIRDEHLKKVMLEVKKSEPLLLRELIRSAPKPAQQVMRRLEQGR